jgi:broad specificity phosphatase PhoE
VVARWRSFQQALPDEQTGRILVVTHAGMLHAAMRVMAPRGSEAVTAGRFRFTPTSLTRVVFEENGVSSATALSDGDHLEPDSPHWVRASESSPP